MSEHDLGEVPGDVAGPVEESGNSGVGPDSPVGATPAPCPSISHMAVPDPVAGPLGDVDLAALDAWWPTPTLVEDSGYTYYVDPSRIFPFDSNGDGIHEVAMAANLGFIEPNGDYGILIAPSPALPSTDATPTPCARAWSREAIHFFDLQGAADYDGDGYEDLMIHEELDEDDGSGLPSEAVWLVTGPLVGDTRIADHVALVPSTDLGWVHNPADVTGDGRPDVISSWYEGYPTIKDACVEVFHDALVDPGSTSRVGLCRPGEDVAFGGTVTAGSDVNGDGIHDIVVSSGGDSFDGFWNDAMLFYGPIDEDRLSDDADLRFGRVSAYLKVADVAGGDLTGDGLDDVVLTAYDAHDWLYVYSGSELSSRRAVVDPVAVVLDCCSSLLGLSTHRTALDISGDVDADGIDDMLVSGYASMSTTNGNGSAYLFYGPVSGQLQTLRDEDAWFHDTEYVENDYPNRQAGGSVATHDFDRDGFADLILADALGPDIHFIRGGW